MHVLGRPSKSSPHLNMRVSAVQSNGFAVIAVINGFVGLRTTPDVAGRPRFLDTVLGHQ
jgi:hypothetical protein